MGAPGAARRAGDRRGRPVRRHVHLPPPLCCPWTPGAGQPLLVPLTPAPRLAADRAAMAGSDPSAILRLLLGADPKETRSVALGQVAARDWPLLIRAAVRIDAPKRWTVGLCQRALEEAPTADVCLAYAAWLLEDAAELAELLHEADHRDTAALDAILQDCPPAVEPWPRGFVHEMRRCTAHQGRHWSKSDEVWTKLRDLLVTVQ